MILVEKHIVKKPNPQWETIDGLSFISKNLYNYALYIIKHHYMDTGKTLRYYEMDKRLRNEHHENYIALPGQTAQQTLILLDKNIKSFFALIKMWKKDKKSLSGCPKFPKYKHKTKGRNIVVFTDQQCRLKEGYIHFPKKTGLKPLKTNVNNVSQVRIVPQFNCYKIEVIYEKEIQKDENLNYENYCSIDLGVDNLCTLTTNQSGLVPLLINGQVIKSYNQFFNKKKAELQSALIKNEKKFSSKRIERLIQKRNRKIDDYLHKVSRMIVNYCIFNHIGNIVVGYNKEWKQEINIGRTNNQKFVNIPFEQLIQKIKYKAELIGINFILHEESYTSKCSALDLESIEKHEDYSGKRISRGRFRTKDGYIINADVNGSWNILRKVIGDGFINLIGIGQGDCPLRVSPYKYISCKPLGLSDM